MTEHNHFKNMCALAVSGQLCEAELRELSKHLEQCFDCRALAAEFEQISIQVLASHRPGFRSCSVPKGMPEGMTKRFVARALSEGVPLSSSEKNPVTSNSLRILNCAGALIAGIVAVSISLSVGIRPVSRSNPAKSPSTSHSIALQSGRAEGEVKRIAESHRRRIDSPRRESSSHHAMGAETAPEKDIREIPVKLYSLNRVPPVFVLRNVSFLDFSDRAAVREPAAEKDTASARLASMHWKLPLNGDGVLNNTANRLLLSQMQQRGAFGADSFPLFRFPALESISSH